MENFIFVQWHGKGKDPVKIRILRGIYPARIYLFKVKNKNTRAMCKIRQQ